MDPEGFDQFYQYFQVELRTGEKGEEDGGKWLPKSTALAAARQQQQVHSLTHSPSV